mgnify:CR=1 FL=1
MLKYGSLGLASGLLVALAGCGGSGSGGGGATVNLSFLSTAVSAQNSLFSTGLTAFSGTYTDLGIATSVAGEGLQSFKMYFREIKICKSLTVSGSGYSNAEGCVTIYSNTSDTYHGTEGPSASERTVMEAAGEGKFYDILSATDRAALSKEIEFEPGEYNYGIVETHPWVKMKAKSGALCTKPTGAAESTSQPYYTRVTSLACGSGAEEALVYITNANTNFRFLTPFTVEAGGSYKLDLAFNMDGAVKALSAGASSTLNDATSGFYVPMVRMVPSPHSASAATKVETYLLEPTGSNGLGNFKIRAEIYYDGSDTTKAPLSIMTTVLAGSNQLPVDNKSIYANSATVEGDVITTKSWAGKVGLTLTRSAEGSEATATLVCSAHGEEGGAFIAASSPASSDDLCSTASEVTLRDADGPDTLTLE